MTAAAIERGVVGAVIDGVVRDIDEISSLGFTLYARGTCPGGPHKGFRGSHGVTIQCGGVVVNPGDVVVGDADGVTVVPSTGLEAALVAIDELREREHRWLERIQAGETSAEILGLD